MGPWVPVDVAPLVMVCEGVIVLLTWMEKLGKSSEEKSFLEQLCNGLESGHPAHFPRTYQECSRPINTSETSTAVPRRNPTSLPCCAQVGEESRCQIPGIFLPGWLAQATCHPCPYQAHLQAEATPQADGDQLASKTARVDRAQAELQPTTGVGEEADMEPEAASAAMLDPGAMQLGNDETKRADLPLALGSWTSSAAASRLNLATPSPASAPLEL